MFRVPLILGLAALCAFSADSPLTAVSTFECTGLYFIRDDEVIFRASITRADGPMYASDYGHQAFPMIMRGPYRHQKQQASAFALNTGPTRPD